MILAIAEPYGNASVIDKCTISTPAPKPGMATKFNFISISFLQFHLTSEILQEAALLSTRRCSLRKNSLKTTCIGASDWLWKSFHQSQCTASNWRTTFWICCHYCVNTIKFPSEVLEKYAEQNAVVTIPLSTSRSCFKHCWTIWWNIWPTISHFVSSGKPDWSLWF